MAYITYTDDGTHISMKAGDVVLMKYRKSDNQMIFPAGVDTDGDF